MLLLFAFVIAIAQGQWVIAILLALSWSLRV